MTVAETVQEICEGLVSGISYIGTGIASGVKAFVQGLMYDPPSTSGGDPTLSSFMIVVIVFGAIALAVGFTTLIFNWIKNLGA